MILHSWHEMIQPKSCVQMDEPDWSKPYEYPVRTVTVEVEHFVDVYGFYAYSELSRKINGVIVKSQRYQDKATRKRSAWAA